MEWGLGALWVPLAWLLGGVPTGVWLARVKGAPDPTRTGSGSSGATNVGRLLGWRWGLAVLLLDSLKGVLAAGLPLALGWPSGWAAAGGLLAVAGHCASPFARFRGGKGVATGCGAALALSPPAAALGLAGWALVLLATRRMAPASLTGVALFPILLPVAGDADPARLGFGALLLAGILFTHRENLSRLRRGVEPTLWGPPAGDPRWRKRDQEPER